MRRMGSPPENALRQGSAFWNRLILAAQRPDAAVIPGHEVKAPARILRPEIQAFFESEEWQQEFAQWKAQHQAQENKK